MMIISIITSISIELMKSHSGFLKNMVSNLLKGISYRSDQMSWRNVSLTCQIIHMIWVISISRLDLLTIDYIINRFYRNDSLLSTSIQRPVLFIEKWFYCISTDNFAALHFIIDKIINFGIDFSNLKECFTNRGLTSGNWRLVPKIWTGH